MKTSFIGLKYTLVSL